MSCAVRSALGPVMAATPESRRGAPRPAAGETLVALITVLRRTRSSFTRPHPGGAGFYVDNVGRRLAQPGLLGGGFETVGPAGPLTTWSASGSNGRRRRAGTWSVRLARRHWAQALFLFGPNGGNKTLHVVTDRQSSGVVQVMGPWAPARKSSVATVQVYVTRGQVGLGVGDGSNTGIGAVSTTTGPLGDPGGSQSQHTSQRIIVYATSPGAPTATSTTQGL